MYNNIEFLNKIRIEEREKERQAMTWQQQLHHLTNRCKKNSGGGGGGSGRADKPEKPTWDLTPNLLTPAMEEVIKMRSKRVSVEIDVPITPEPSDGESDSEEEEEEEEEEEDLDEQIRYYTHSDTEGILGYVRIPSTLK